MMKMKLIAASFPVAMLSFNAAYARGSHNHDEASHGKSMETHNEHASAIGKPGDAAQVTRTIAVDMADNMRFTPAKIAVEKARRLNSSWKTRAGSSMRWCWVRSRS